MTDEILVSICCLVYNHEKYLRKCLDGFIMQKTTFKYEVLIHDDASTDHSTDIIREYEKKYPDIIKPIYQTENQYSKGKHIWWEYQFPASLGKYIALCEGDDYWSDEHKLQKQFNALENNKDCVLCAHRVRFVTENGNYTNRSLPAIVNKSIVISEECWIKMICNTPYLFQTSSYFFRKDIIGKYLGDLPEFIKKANVGDTPLMLLLATEGKCCYIEKEMSCYRLNSVSSWTRSMKSKITQKIHVDKSKEYLCEYNQYTNKKYSEEISNYINRIEISYEFSNNNFKAIFYKKYRNFVNKLPLSKRIVYTIFAIVPFSRVLFLKLRNTQ